MYSPKSSFNSNQDTHKSILLQKHIYRPDMMTRRHPAQYFYISRFCSDQCEQGKYLKFSDFDGIEHCCQSDLCNGAVGIYINRLKIAVALVTLYIMS